MRTIVTIVLSAGIAILMVGLLYSSAITTEIPGRFPALVICDGSTRVTAETCRAWGADLVGGELDLPQGMTAEDVARLEIERAFWGYLDVCTVRVYLVGSSSPDEQATDCR
jgi:hypothetical protein